jgi:hypothetical protein
MIHCETETMLSCVSFKVDSFALRASSEKAILPDAGSDARSAEAEGAYLCSEQSCAIALRAAMAEPKREGIYATSYG